MKPLTHHEVRRHITQGSAITPVLKWAVITKNDSLIKWWSNYLPYLGSISHCVASLPCVELHKDHECSLNFLWLLPGWNYQGQTEVLPSISDIILTVWWALMVSFIIEPGDLGNSVIYSAALPISLGRLERETVVNIMKSFCWHPSN